MTSYIKQGDCLELLKELPDDSVDLIVTDPPYLVNYKTGHRKDKQHKFCTAIANDNNPEVITSALKQFYRVLKNDSAMYMFCSADKVDYFKQELEAAGFNIKNMIIWIKNSWTAGDLYAAFGRQYEIIFLVNKGRALFHGKRITDVWQFNRVAGAEQVHQNQKPLDLLEQCIEKHSNAGDIVLDAFMGSGSTCVAAINTGRKYIGFEIDPEYFEIAKNRIIRAEADPYDL